MLYFLVGLSFYQCGVYLAFIFHSYNHVVSEWRSQTYFVWALLFAVLGGYLATMLLSLSRALVKRIVWLHYYLLAVGSALLLAAGLVLIISRGEQVTHCQYLQSPDNRVIHPHTQPSTPLR